MTGERTDQKKTSTLANLWRAALAVVEMIAIAGELRRPPRKRTGTGIADLVPYDFRMPTADRSRETYWNPDGPIVSSKLWAWDGR